ncbi:MAG: glycosyltransferase family A protein [Bacteroidota bacterium]
MRKGYNPNKDREISPSYFTHQVVIPVYIPHHENYFKDVFKNFKICLKSVIKTSHSKTFISIINNGCCKDVTKYLWEIKEKNQIQELIVTENLGKFNAIVKGLAGHNIPLITITDADILFLNNWQSATVKVFNEFPKAGVVGLIPQFLTYQNKSENLLLDYFWNDRLRFVPVKNPVALANFYKSIGWKPNYSPAKLKYTLGITGNNGFIACAGSGHAVATYRRELFENDFPLFNPFKMGGGSEQILDDLSLKFDYYRFTTYDNFAYHLGNVYEEWMGQTLNELNADQEELTLQNAPREKKIAGTLSTIKVKLLNKALKSYKLRMLFLKHKGLPKKVRKFF